MPLAFIHSLVGNEVWLFTKRIKRQHSCKLSKPTDSKGHATATSHDPQVDKGVVVANAKSELVAFAKSLDRGEAYLAKQPYAAGVQEGLEHYTSRF